MKHRRHPHPASAQLTEAIDAADVAAALNALQNGAPVNGQDTQPAPLFQAVLKKSPEMVRLLLEHGADPNIRDDLGTFLDCTPLFFAGVNCARILLKHGADAAARDELGQTALFYLAWKPDDRAEETARVRLLLEHGTPGNAVSPSGATALFYVREPESVRLLLEAGAPAASINREDEGRNALYYHRSTPECVKILLEAGADPNVTDEEWGCSVCTPSTPTETVRLLLEHGFNPNLTSKGWYTTPPIAMGVSRETALLLQQAGADVNLRFRACEHLPAWHYVDRNLATTPIGWLLYSGQWEAAETLLQLDGAAPGMTELYWALRSGEPECEYRSAAHIDTALSILLQHAPWKIAADTLNAYRENPELMLTPDFFLDGIVKPYPQHRPCST